jgi:hypothetical protein
MWPAVTVDNAKRVTVTYTRSSGGTLALYSRTFAVSTAPGSCSADATALCLNGSRFEVRVTWRDFTNGTGSGQAVPVSGDTGYFWFFNGANVELVVKVLDGTWLNGNYWVFYGALSNVEYTLTVTDTVFGNSVTYYNPSGSFASTADTSGLPGLGGGSRHLFKVVEGSQPGAVAASAEWTPLGAGSAKVDACTSSGTALCLNDDRFRVEVSWRNYNDGSTGDGQAVPLTGDTGYFWFFSDTNVELILKVLDGRAINGYFWVFYGALSDVEFEITVTDTETGQVKTYSNPAHQLASVGDTAAFQVP